MDMLTSSAQSDVLTCSIVGMGGTGKTTLAKKIYDNKIIVNHFDIRGWVTVSQEFNVRELLVVLLENTNAPCDTSLDYYQLGEGLFKHLFGRRYLIVMDDVWDIEVVGKLKVFFPHNGNGSRVMVTTRISNVKCDFNYEMKFLDKKQSWELLSEIVFGKSSCPTDLKDILEMIARNCRGLLLSISVIGGLIAHSDMTQRFLQDIAQDTASIVNSSNDDHCMEILSTSYNHLGVNLKPCFLYLGVFEEDRSINIQMLIRLWVSEGFLKPNKVKSLEEVAEDYLKDLIARNLIYVSDPVNFLSCRIHDLLRDLCLREARKQRFLYATKYRNLGLSQGLDGYRRVAVHGSYEEIKNSTQLGNEMRSSFFTRSLIFSSEIYLPKTFDVKLLRVLCRVSCIFEKKNEDMLKRVHEQETKLFNLRYTNSVEIFKFPNLVHLFWNLQTAHYHRNNPAKFMEPLELWEMPLLRHISIERSFYLPDPCVGVRGNVVVLENLQTLLNVHDFRCTNEVVQKIPNIRELGVAYRDSEMEINLQNLAHLHKLQSLTCNFPMKQSRLLFQALEFPISLKMLKLSYFIFDWEEDVNQKIGSLPRLEKLTMLICKSVGKEWNTIEGQFQRLKVLHLHKSDLVRWKTDSSHFPRLELLRLYEVKKLEEIPSEIGDIPTLQNIFVLHCSDSARDSAKTILDEQRSYGNEDLQILLAK